MDFKKFLANARLQGYANGKDENRIELSKGGKEFVHKEEEYESRDRYYGHDPFVGQRIVWRKTKPYWVMNYYGHVFPSSEISTEEIYKFLREALLNPNTTVPIRGSNIFRKGNLSYTNHIGPKDTLENFQGIEEILCKGKVVYKFIYHGGYVKDKQKNNI